MTSSGENSTFTARLGRSAARLSPARVLKAAAGIPGAIRRRGSVLVIVLGTLAMMSVLAVVFVTVGQSDRRASAAAQRQAKLDDVPEQVSRYVAGVIANDLFALYPSPEGVATNGSRYQATFGLRRETWDYPSSDRAMLSIPGQGAQDGRSQPGANEVDIWRFRPEGHYPRLSFDEQLGNMSSNTLQRRSSDPWLASETCNLTFDDDIATQGSGGGGVGIPGFGTPDWYNRRDYGQISNFAPDGRAVNLFNLLPQSLGGFGFDAPSGIGPGTISDKLTLMDEDQEPQPVGGTQLRIDGEEADPNVPADWFSLVRGIAVAPSTGSPSIGWDDPRYLAYQYADADGDGILDSRWCELVDATMPGELKSLLVTDGKMRYFLAFRAIDLTARINVNTAGDFTQGPTTEHPVGWTPADIDARRLFTLEDARQEYLTGAGPTDPYPFYQPPLTLTGQIDTNSPAYYDEYDSENAFNGNRVSIGVSAYDAVRVGAITGAVLPRQVTRETLQAYLDAEYQAVFGGAAPQVWELTPAQRFELFTNASAEGLGVAARRDQTTGTWTYRPAHLYGDADLQELLTYNGCNDSEVRSSLESMVGARFADGLNLDPLRTNRPTSLERGDRDGFDRNPPTGFSPQTQRDSDSDWLDTDADAYLQLATDIRSRLTTESGARPFYSRVVSGPGPLSDSDLKIDISTLAQDSSALFSLYASALLPYSSVEGAWDPTNLELRTLHYGYNGPELALRNAGHMALNLPDAVDTDATAGSATVLVRANAPGGGAFGEVIAQDQANPDPSTRQYPWVTGAVLDLGAARLAPDATPPTSDAVVMYGIEPQPVITEVGTYYVYTDMPTGANAGGDDENAQSGGGGGTGGGGGGGGGGGTGEATLLTRYDPPTVNPDFLFHAVAVQISNPFQTPLSLADHYIEFNGRHYSLRGLSLNGVYPGPATDFTIAAGQSMTFCLFTSQLSAIQMRMDAADKYPGGRIIGGGNRIDAIGAFIKNQLAPNNDIANAVLLGQPIADIQDLTPPTADIDAAPFFRRDFEDLSNAREIRLWKAHKVGGDDFPNDATRDNLAENDQLLDRMTFPASLGLNRKLSLPRTAPPPLRGYAIPRATADKENVFTNANYNQGLTIFTYARVRRPTDTTLAAGSVAVPMWAVEGRWESNWNDHSQDEVSNLTRLDADDFKALGPAKDNCFFRFSSPLDNRDFADCVIYCMTNGAAPAPADNEVRTDDRMSLHKHARTKTGNDKGLNLSSIPLQRLRVELHQGIDARYMRVGDILLPQIIGPEYHPDLAGGPGEWLTLPEAMAMGMDYSRAPVGTSGPMATYIGEMGRQRNPTANTPPTDIHGMPMDRGPMDRGHIVLDDFVPFIDESPQTPVVRFTPRDGDVRMGLGLTPAMSILERVRGMGNEFGSTTLATPGVVNLNTASRMVLRTLPMVTPTADEMPDWHPTDPSGRAWWWAGATTHGRSTDIGATIWASREKTLATPRVASIQSFPSFPISFEDGKNPDSFLYGGRAAATYISGLREDLGFVSLGEVLGIKEVDQGPTFPDVNARIVHNIDRLGFDTTANYDNVNREGVDPVRYPNTPNNDDGIANDFDEKLAVANALFNTTSVRSDYFAVWFVMHGYQRSDVEGMTAGSPLVPSIARRFMMVVDRSNVVRPGDMPRVVFFKEVPM